LFRDTIFLSARLKPSTPADPRPRLVDGEVQRMGSAASDAGASGSAKSTLGRSGPPQKISEQAATMSAPAEGELLTIGKFGAIAQLDESSWVGLDELNER
jgi:hypothetical protein